VYNAASNETGRNDGRSANVDQRFEASASLNSFKSELNPNYISIPSPYRAVNTHRLSYKNQPVMLYSEMIAVHSQIHTKHTNTACGPNVGFMYDKPGGGR
jgi:hypothetical protein